METGGPCEALIERARADMTVLREAEFAVLETVMKLIANGAAAAGGYRSTERLLEDLWRMDPSHAKRLVAGAEQLCERVSFTGEPLPALMPAMSAVCAQGVAGREHVAVVLAAMRRIAGLPHLEPAEVTTAEAILAGATRTLAPAQVVRVARRLTDQLDPDGAAPPDPDEPTDVLHLVRQHRNGALTLGGLFADRANADLIVEAMDALSAPAGPDDARSLDQRRAEAFLDLCAQALSPTGIATDTRSATQDSAPAEDDDATDAPSDTTDGTDETDPLDVDEPAGDVPADHGDGEDADAHEETGAANAARSGAPADRPRPCPSLPVLGRGLLTVTMDADWLRQQIGYGLLDSDWAISPAAVRRIACDAAVVPIVLGGRSEPLDVGRLRYTVPDALRRALHQRDRGCSWPGCHRRPKRCHAHHVIEWQDFGETCLDNTCLLCRYHHTVIHNGHWKIEMIDGRPWFIPPRWLDPKRTPRPGGPYLESVG